MEAATVNNKGGFLTSMHVYLFFSAFCFTVSDSCFNKTAQDRSGANLKALIEEKHV